MNMDKILKYGDFINSDNLDGLGDLCDELCENPDIRNLILSKIDTEHIDYHIGISGIVNSLPNNKKREIWQSIRNTWSGDTPLRIDASVELNESYSDGVLNSFFKSLTALGIHNISPFNGGDNSLLRHSWVVSWEKLETVFTRFRSLTTAVGDWRETPTIFYEIDLLGVFRYGVDDLIIGEFKLNKSKLDKIKFMNWRSTLWLKDSLSDLDMASIKILLRSVNQVIKWNTPKSIVLESGMTKLEFDRIDVDEFKDDFKQYIKKYKLVEGILVSFLRNSNSLFLYIKPKKYNN